MNLCITSACAVNTINELEVNGLMNSIFRRSLMSLHHALVFRHSQTQNHRRQRCRSTDKYNSPVPTNSILQILLCVRPPYSWPPWISHTSQRVLGVASTQKVLLWAAAYTHKEATNAGIFINGGDSSSCYRTPHYYQPQSHSTRIYMVLVCDWEHK
jgi:hypothetical protein